MQDALSVPIILAAIGSLVQLLTACVTYKQNRDARRELRRVEMQFWRIEERLSVLERDRRNDELDRARRLMSEWHRHV